MYKPLFLILYVIFCSSCNTQLKNDSSLPVLDISKSYPTRNINVHDIADVEYIPLETTEKSILASPSVHFRISDKYIVTYDIALGNVYFFARNGKFLWTFNKRGDGPEEYNSIGTFVSDFTSEECYISDGTPHLFVYTFKGDFKRAIPIPSDTRSRFFTELYNYDKDYLIGYNGSIDNDGINDTPYKLIHKQTGDIVLLDITTEHHISPIVNEEIITKDEGETRLLIPNRSFIPRHSLLKNGSEYLIAEYTFDTLYTYKDNKISPLAVRTPSVYKNSPPLVIVPYLFTDSILNFQLYPTKYNPQNPPRIVDLFWNRNKNIIEHWNIHDPNYSEKGTLTLHSFMLECTDSNYGFTWYTPNQLIEKGKAGELKGELKKMALKLKTDDNNILVLCKFK